MRRGETIRQLTALWDLRLEEEGGKGRGIKSWRWGEKRFAGHAMGVYTYIYIKKVVGGALRGGVGVGSFHWGIRNNGRGAGGRGLGQL